jgi:hypothetical protein
MRKIEIEWRSLGESITVTLNDEYNQDFTNPLWDSLPYRTLQGHALVAGDCFYHVPPVHGVLSGTPDHKVDRQAMPLGTVLCSAAQHLTVKYGKLTEPMPASPIGQVDPEHLHKLPDIGQRIWHSVYYNRSPIIAEVRRFGVDGGGSLIRMKCSKFAASKLIEEIAAESERVLVEPPSDLVDIHAGKITSEAGTKRSLLTTLVFVNGETRPLGYMTYTALVRAATQTQMPLVSLKQMADLLIPKPSTFLSYCGMKRFGELSQAVMEILASIETKSDFVALMSHMALYVNALGAWNLQLFPWSLEKPLLDRGTNTR